MFTNYREGILSYIAAIRRYYNLTSSYAPDEAFGQLLKKAKPAQIILTLIDGMGSRLIKRKLPPDSFLLSHLYTETETVFPPTTTAATTAILNGKAPNENAWLGWSQYLKEDDDIIVPFLNKGYYSHRQYPQDHFQTIIPVTTTIGELEAKGIKCDEIYPAFRENGCVTIAEFGARIAAVSQAQTARYVYAYWNNYDAIMHKEGVDAPKADLHLALIDAVLAKAAAELDPRTLLVIIADHGMINVEEEINLYDSKYEQYLRLPPSLEPRATAFFIKNECLTAFEAAFKAEYADDFILLSKEQVLKAGIFGIKANHPRFSEFIGDYLAIAKNFKHFIYTAETKHFAFKGHHAGAHIDERMIPLIIYQKGLTL